MADQQRYSEEEVYSILREAVRLPSTDAQNGFTREQIASFAADAGISDEALEQCLEERSGRRRARVDELFGKTAITFDWELRTDEMDRIATLCGATPPLTYHPGDGFDIIEANGLGFSGVVKVFPPDGFTQLELTRLFPLEITAIWSLVALMGSTVAWFVLSLIPGVDSEGKALPSTPAWPAVGLLIGGLVLLIGTVIYKSRKLAKFRSAAVEQILSEFGAVKVRRMPR